MPADPVTFRLHFGRNDPERLSLCAQRDHFSDRFLLVGLIMMTSRRPRSSSGSASGPVRTRVSCGGEASNNAFKGY